VYALHSGYRDLSSMISGPGGAVADLRFVDWLGQLECRDLCAPDPGVLGLCYNIYIVVRSDLHCD
jgi:hypothetical protein